MFQHLHQDVNVRLDSGGDDGALGRKGREERKKVRRGGKGGGEEIEWKRGESD